MSMPIIHSRTPLWLIWIVSAIVVALLDTHDRSARADAPTGRYTAGTDGATPWVKDNRTGLVWKKIAESGKFSWDDAKTQCTGTCRLPDVRELQSLVDET